MNAERVVGRGCIALATGFNLPDAAQALGFDDPGLLRWPGLAAWWQGPDAQGRAAIEAMFPVLHPFGGVAVGEYLGLGLTVPRGLAPTGAEVVLGAPVAHALFSAWLVAVALRRVRAGVAPGRVEVVPAAGIAPAFLPRRSAAQHRSA